MCLRRHCGLPRVLNSPVFQLALMTGPYFVNGRDPIWTGIPGLWRSVLYQLSYAPTEGAFKG